MPDPMRNPKRQRHLESVRRSIQAGRADRRALPESACYIGVQVPSSPTPLREYVPATSPFPSNSMAPEAPS